MKWALVRVALATTSMVALAFVIPLALVAAEIARDRAVSEARQQAVTVLAVLVVSEEPERPEKLAQAIATTTAGSAERVAVYLPELRDPLGTPRAAAADVELALVRRQAIMAKVPGGLAYLQPTALEATSRNKDRIAVVEIYIPESELRRGVVGAWWAMSVVAVLLVVGSVVVADRLAKRIVAATHDLAVAARALGRGDLSARVTPAGPPELAAAGGAFNAMADRVVAFVDAERELAADLSHRLRTPLTALRLDAETLPRGAASDRIRQAVDILQNEVDEIIRNARQPTSERAVAGTEEERTDLVDVVADRLAFWAVLAEDHGRDWAARQVAHAVWVKAPRADLVAAVDALLGNIFQHTPQGTPFRVAVTPDSVVVEDAGPGIPDPESALRRGGSGAGSTGLGLDIARRVADAAGGFVRIDRSGLGGARVTMHVGGSAEKV